MQRVKFHINTLRLESEAQQTAADSAMHQARLEQLLTQVQAEPEVEIPPPLHEAGPQTMRLVSARDIVYLHEGKAIARAVRALLPHGAGNQRLAVAQSQGRAVALTLGTEIVSAISNDASWPAISAVLTGAGNCDAAARIAFELARSRDIPSAIVSDHLAGHVFALLHPDSTNPVVVDGWPIFPSSCLLADSPFRVDSVTAKHHAGDVVPTQFNLSAIDALRQRVRDTLGEQAIENVMLENRRQHCQLRLPSLDHLLLDQGLLHYHQLKPDRMAPSQRAIFDAEMPRLKTQTGDAILHFIANLVSTQSTENQSQQRLWQNGAGTTQGQQAAAHTARTTAREKAQHLARTDAGRLVVQKAREATNRCADLELSRRHAHTEMRGLAVATAESTVTVHARAKPTLWHYLLHGGNIRYQSPGGQSHCIATAPQSLIDATLSAKVTAECLGYPEHYRQPDRRSEHDTTQSDISDAELMQHCVARIAEQLTALRSSTELPYSADRAACEIALLQEIDERIEDIPPAIQETVLVQLAELLPQLHPDALEHAVVCWMCWEGNALPGNVFVQACIALQKTWLACLTDDFIEAAIRPAILRCTAPDSVIEFATTQLPLQLDYKSTLLEVIDDCWSQLDDDAAKAQADQWLAKALDKTDDQVMRRSGQQILERHRTNSARAP